MAFKLVAGYLQSFVDAKDEHTALQSLNNLQNVVTQEMSADEQGHTIIHSCDMSIIIQYDIIKMNE
jgi:hypothetical protein